MCVFVFVCVGCGGLGGYCFVVVVVCFVIRFFM